MDFQSYLGDPQPLSQWVTACPEKPGLGDWLVFVDPHGEVKPTLETEMYPITGNTGDLSDDEFLEFENSIHANGYSNFLNLDQLEDILINLAMQKRDYSQLDLKNAIDHYFTRDAFINLENE